MANVTIVTTGNFIDIDFGIYAPGVGDKGRFQRSDIKNILKINGDYIEINMGGQFKVWQVNLVAGSDGIFAIDTIDGVAPTDMDDLFSKLISLMV